MKRNQARKVDDDLNILTTVTGRDAGEKQRKRRKRRIIPIILLVLLLLFVWSLVQAFLIEPHMLTITRRTLTLPGLPDSWEGRRIAFFSDTHVGPDYSVEQLNKVADAMVAESPDLILFGGDLVDHRTPTDEAYEQSVGDVLARMRAPLGQYAISGNHDNRLRAELLLMYRMLDRGGFELLRNESVDLDGIWLGGLEESYFGNPDLDLAYSAEGLIEPDERTGTVGESSGDGNFIAPDFRILLMHQPDFAAEQYVDDANLILSGHSHNGQVTFFGKPLLTVHQGSRYPYGAYTLTDRSTLVVSRGLGTVAVAARLFAAPELMIDRKSVV